MALVLPGRFGRSQIGAMVLLVTKGLVFEFPCDSKSRSHHGESSSQGHMPSEENSSSAILTANRLSLTGCISSRP